MSGKSQILLATKIILESVNNECLFSYQAAINMESKVYIDVLKPHPWWILTVFLQSATSCSHHQSHFFYSCPFPPNYLKIWGESVGASECASDHLFTCNAIPLAALSLGCPLEVERNMLLKQLSVWARMAGELPNSCCWAPPLEAEI